MTATASRTGRLSVRELLAAVEAARAAASQPAAGTDQQAAGVVASVLDGTAPLVEASVDVAPAAVAVTTVDTAEPADSGEGESEGPVSLAAAPTPRLRSARRAAPAVPDARLRRDKPRDHRRTTGEARTVERVRAAVEASGPLRLWVMPACGGAGATTVATLLAQLIGAAAGRAVLGRPLPDAGALVARSGADELDPAAWGGDVMPAGTAGAVSVLAPQSAPDRGVLVAPAVWPLLPEPLVVDAGALWVTAQPAPTHVLIAAPRAPGGLLAAEAAAADLASRGLAPVTVAAVQLRRGTSRTDRAAAARLRAAGLALLPIPFDTRLARPGPVSWAGLPPRTQAAVAEVLIHVLEPSRRSR